MLTWIYAGRIMSPDQVYRDSVIIVEDGCIKAIESRMQVNPRAAGVLTIDAADYLVIPGLIDAHVHGSAGYDTMDASPDALKEMSAFFAKHGVTAFLATTITQSNTAIGKAIENLLLHRGEVEGAYPLGIHLEGPYLSAEYRGAQPREYLRDPEPTAYQDWLASGIIRRMTVAPELPGVSDLIRSGIKHGVQFSAGHSGANLQQMQQAIEAGLSQSTHTFNGMAGLHHREPGILGVVLTDDRITCEVIADGVHVHPVALQLLARVKGAERIALVTDAIRAAGLEDGDYDLGGQVVSVRQHIARTNSSGLAGSTLTLEQAIRNMNDMGKVPIQQAVTMATKNAAAVAGYAGQRGEIKPGADADITIVDSDFNILLTMVAGRVVYSAINIAKDERRQ